MSPPPRRAALGLWCLAAGAHAQELAGDGGGGDALRISALSVRLPAGGQYQLSAFPAEECFRWTTTRPDLLELNATKSSDSCSPSVTVTARRDLDGAHSAKVVATTGGNHKSLRCDVYVDAVAEISVRVTQSKLGVGCERLVRVMARDAVGNTFSSVEGLPFAWRAADSTPSAAEEPARCAAAALCTPRSHCPCTAVKPLLLDDSTQKSSERRRQLEVDDSLMSDEVVLFASEAGSATVEVALDNSTGAWRQEAAVAPARVHVDVVEPLLMEPEIPTLVVEASCFAYRLSKQLQCSEKELPIQMPHAQYSWESSDAAVVAVDPQFGSVTAMGLGDTTIAVRDALGAGNDGESQLGVVEADEIEVGIRPSGRDRGPEGPSDPKRIRPDHDGVWHLVRGEQYTFHTLLFDDTGAELGERPGSRRSIFIAPNVEVTPVLEGNRGWETAASDHESVTATPGKLGPTVISASFSTVRPCAAVDGTTDGVGNSHYSEREPYQLQPALNKHQKVHVQERVAIAQAWSELVLPRPDELPEPNRHPVQATGGSGTYLWHVDDSSVVTVDADGVLTALKEGTTVLSCQDRWNAENFDTRKVVVSRISTLALARAPHEVQVGETLQLGAVLRDPQGRQMDSCFAAEFEMQVGARSIFSTVSTAHSTAHSARERFSDPKDDETVVGSTKKCKKLGDVGRKACWVMDLRGEAEGESEVSISWAGRGLSLSASLTYAAFTPLAILAPTERKAVASIGCTTSVVFRGGPRWLATKEAVVVEPETQSSVVQVDEVSVQSATRRYVATCGGLGEQALSVRVGNQLSCKQRQDYVPTVRVVPIDLKCATPRSIELAPLGHHGTLSETREVWQTAASEADEEAVRMCAATEHTIGVVAYTGDGQTGDRFTNASSLEVTWAVDSAADSGITAEPNDSWGEMLVRSDASPSALKVSAAATAYAAWLPESLRALAPEEPTGLNDALPLLFLPAPRFSADHRTLYSNPANILEIETQGGSSLFDFSVSDGENAVSELASVQYVKPVTVAAPWPRPTAKLALHTPCEADDLLVAIRDAGVIGCGPVQMKISLSHLYGLELKTPLQCELGGKVTAEVLASTRRGEIFDLDQTALMNLKLQGSNDTVAGNKAAAPGVFTVSAQCVGALNMTLSAAPKGQPATAVACGGGALSDPDEAAEGIAPIAAKPVELGVYVPLHCLPETITLVPQAQAAVHCVSGPRDAYNRSYHIISDDGQPEVARVDKNGVVTAIGVGSVSVRVVYSTEGTLTHPSATATAVVPIRVAELTDIKINAGVNWMAPGMEAAVHVEGSSGQSPLSLANLPIQCQWASENASVIALSVPAEPSNTAALAARLRAVSIGQSRLQVFCVVRSGGLAQNYSDEVEMHGEEPLALIGPPTLLLRPGSRAEVKTNRPASQLAFRVISAASTPGGDSAAGSTQAALGAITVDTGTEKETLEHALVVASTAASEGVVYLAIECSRRGEVQALLVAVEVRSIAAVHWRLLEHNVVALGSSVSLGIDLSDSHGRQFAPLVVRETPLHFSQSHRVMELTVSHSGGDTPGTSVTLTGASLGATVVTVMVGEGSSPPAPRCASDLEDEDILDRLQEESLADYLQLEVIDVVQPTGLFHVGSAVRLALAPGTEELFPALRSAASHRWRSAQRHVLYLDAPPAKGAAEDLTTTDGADERSGEAAEEVSGHEGGHAHVGELHAATAHIHYEAMDEAGTVVWQTRTEAFISRITELSLGDEGTTLSDASGLPDRLPVHFFGVDADGDRQLLSDAGHHCADGGSDDGRACLDHRINFTCSSPDTDFVSNATALFDPTAEEPYVCELVYNSEAPLFPPTLSVAVTAGDGSGSYSVDTEASFEFVGAFDLRPAESVNLWPQRGNITVEVLRARRPITAVVPEEAASWGLYATPSPEEGDKRFTVGVGPAAWRAEFGKPPDSWEASIVFECAEIDQTQTLKVHYAQASYERPVDAMTAGVEIEPNQPQLPGGLATRCFGVFLLVFTTLLAD